MRLLVQLRGCVSMSRASVLARGRAAAEAGMVDTCTVTRITGESVDADGVTTPTTSQIYSGRCRVQVRAPSAAGSGHDLGEAYVIVQRVELQIPIAAAALQEADVVTVNTAAHDPALAGRTYAVQDMVEKTHLTARRATLLEVTS